MRRATVLAAMGLILCAMVAAAAQHSKPKVHTVTMQGNGFHPEVLTVKSGDTIVWVNKDLVPHTATSDSFDSQTIAAGKSWRTTFHAKGDFPYGCTFHPTMRAILHVK
jgi:plastocyanin